MNKIIKVNCETKHCLSYKELDDFQGDLKRIKSTNLDKLKRSIVQHGIIAPAFIWKSGKKNYILDAHQRLNAFKSLISDGYTLPDIPIVYVNAKNRKDAKAILLKISSQFGSFDKDGFELFTEDLDLVGLMDDIDLADFNFTIEADESEEEDKIPDDVPNITKKGDLWELCEHRLLCGSSTSEDDIYKLTNGCIPDFIHADPPYGMNAVSKSGVLSKNYKKDIMGDDDQNVAKESFLLLSRLYPDSIQVWWGANYYCSVLPDAEGWIVWDKNNGGSDQTDCELAWSNIRTVIRSFIQSSEKSGRVHPTQKPVSLVEWMFTKYKLNAYRIADFFGGSGVTMIFAEKSGKVCQTMELDPYYCDVIVKRFFDWCVINKIDCPIKLNGKKFNVERLG